MFFLHMYRQNTSTPAILRWNSSYPHIFIHLFFIDTLTLQRAAGCPYKKSRGACSPWHSTFYPGFLSITIAAAVWSQFLFSFIILCWSCIGKGRNYIGREEVMEYAKKSCEKLRDIPYQSTAKSICKV